LPWRAAADRGNLILSVPSGCFLNIHIMKIICIRHTAVDVSKGICYGQKNVNVSSSYPEELLQIKEKLKSMDIPDKIYTSPLLRCFNLAEDLFPDYSVIQDTRLEELNFGVWEGKTWDEIYAQKKGRYWMDHYLSVCCPKGESYQDLKNRILSFCSEISLLKSSNIVLVTHAGVIRIIRSVITKEPIEKMFSDFSPEYGGVYKFEIK